MISLPFTVLREVDIRPEIWNELPPAQQQAIKELGYGTNSKLICGFDRRVWAAKGFTGATFSDLGYQSCWETSRGQAGTHGILTNFLGGKAGVAFTMDHPLFKNLSMHLAEKALTSKTTAQVNVELVSGYLTITQPSEIKAYADAFAALADIAVYGTDARRLIAAAIATLG